MVLAREARDAPVTKAVTLICAGVWNSLLQKSHSCAG